jgi:hypothetical protein
MPRRHPPRRKPARRSPGRAPRSRPRRIEREELKRLRLRVAELERLAEIAQLATTVARQAWNPLTSMALSIDLLARRTQDSETLRRLSQLDEERKRVANFLRDFFEFAALRRREKKS